MAFTLHIDDDVDPRLRKELVVLGEWVDQAYGFPIDLELRIAGSELLVDDDGDECFMRWRQAGTDETVFVDIATGRFARNLEVDGEGVAFPTVIAAIGRGLQVYFQICRGEEWDEVAADVWGDRFLDAYTDGEVEHPVP